MEVALRLAREAAAEGEVPVGAVVLDAAGQVIGRGRNLREADRDPLAHAEVKAMTEAAHALGTWNLADCTRISAASSSGRGMPSLVHAARFGIFPVIRISAASRKSSAACTNRNVRGSSRIFSPTNESADRNRPHGMPYGIVANVRITFRK